MKTKLTATTAAMAALIGLSHIAHADGGNQFTPVEDLPPEQRQEVFNQVAQMTNGAELDWDHVVVGVDANGQVVILQKDRVALQGAGAPSSFGRTADDAGK